MALIPNSAFSSLKSWLPIFSFPGNFDGKHVEDHLLRLSKKELSVEEQHFQGGGYWLPTQV